MRIASRLYYCAGIVILLFLGVAASAADQTIVLKAARIFDGKSKSLIPNGVVVVQGDKIVDVGSNLAGPAGAKMIDLGDATLSPGSGGNSIVRVVSADSKHITATERVSFVMKEGKVIRNGPPTAQTDGASAEDPNS